MALPLTFGIGVEYSINFYDRVRKLGDIRQSLQSVGGAIAACSLTTMLGYGTLLFGDNLALRSFGKYAVIGELSCLCTALVVLPAGLHALSSSPNRRCRMTSSEGWRRRASVLKQKAPHLVREAICHLTLGDVADRADLGSHAARNSDSSLDENRHDRHVFQHGVVKRLKSPIRLSPDKNGMFSCPSESSRGKAARGEVRGVEAFLVNGDVKAVALQKAAGRVQNQWVVVDEQDRFFRA